MGLGRSRSRSYHSLATKFSVFTAALIIWTSLLQIVLRWQDPHLSWSEQAVATAVLTAFAVLLARLTSRVFVRPLVLLERAIAGVAEGRREPIPVSRTGDEIERLGHSFNQMIAELAASEREVREYQTRLEEKIHERTAALREAIQRAHAAAQAKSDFLANMSHELRTPMNGILGMIELVLEGPLSAQQREDLVTARNSCLALLALINDVLDMSKIEAGKMTLEKAPFSPAAVALETVKAMEPTARQKGLGFEHHVSPDVPGLVLGDSLRFRQILFNLLGNAIKFTEKGSVRLAISCGAPSAPDRAVLEIEVSDTGVGIPRDKLEAIFEKFTQADGSVSRRYGGSGLGLAITKELVQMHGGRITVESQVGQGSTFRVSLEFERSDEHPHPPETPAVRGAPRQGPARILIVEDDPVTRVALCRLLARRGYETAAAETGKEALAALEAGAFDLILMDLQLPDGDGLELTKQLRRDPRWTQVPVIAVTAAAGRGQRELCLAAGLTDYVPKPVRTPELLETIRRYV